MTKPETKLLVNGHVVTVDGQRTIHSPGYVAVEGTRIVGVGPMRDRPPLHEYAEILDVGGMLVLPGLVNAHQHHWYTLFKGMSEGMLLEDWFEDVVLPLSAHISADDLRVSGYLAALEMLSTGTTTFLNHSVTSTTAADVAASIEPFADMGIRQVFCKELRVGSGRDEDRAIADLEEVIRRWDDPRERMVTVGAVIETGAHWLKTGVTSEELIRRGSRVAAGRGLRISDHITGASIWRAIAARIRSEGRNDIEHLMGLGVLGPHWILVHCTWINDREIKFCAESGAHVVVCPASGAYTAGGAAPIRTFLAEGLSVALGSDGPMVNDSVDMVEQMKHTALLQNIRYLTPAAVSSEQLIEMTTLSGARVLGLADEIGTIEVGKRADIAVFDMSGWHWGVPLRPHAALVFAGKGTDAKHVLVNGVFRVRDGQPQATGRLIGSVRHEARERAEALVQHAGLTSLLQRGWSPHRADREERHTNGESARRETRHDG